MNIAGHATAKGTDEYCRRFLDRFDQGHFHSVEKLRWSSIGLGTYLGKPDAKTDKLVAKAVIQSIEGGINVIDTAINYRRQHGEKSIGAALRNIVTKGKYNRDEFIPVFCNVEGKFDCISIPNHATTLNKSPNSYRLVLKF